MRGSRYITGSILKKTGSSLRGIIDLFAGTGCLAESVLRMAQLKGSYGTIEYVILVDKKPRPLLLMYFDMFLLRMLPGLPRELKLRIIQRHDVTEELAQLADALNRLIAFREMELAYSGIAMPRQKKAMNLKMEPYFLRWLWKNGMVTVILRDYKEYLEKLQSSNGTKWYKAGMGFLVDPPWRGSDRKWYQNRQWHGLEAVKELDRHEPGYVIYIDYYDALQEVVEELANLKVAGLYKLNNPIHAMKQKGTTEVYAVFLTIRGLDYVPKLQRRQKYRFVREEENEVREQISTKFLEQYEEWKKSKRHVREFFKRRDEHLIKELARELPPYDWLRKYVQV